MEDLQQELTVARAMIQQLLSTLEEKDVMLEKLQQQLESLLKHRFGQRADRVDPAQLMLFLKELEGKALEEEPEEKQPKEEASDRGEPKKKRKGHGRKKLSKDLRRERIEHDIPEEEKVCGTCESPKSMIREKTTELLEFVPASLKVLQHVELIYACPKGCEGEMVKGEKPRQPIEKSVAGPGLLSHVVVSKFADHLPLNRQEGILKRHGVDIGRSTLWEWTWRTAEVLRPLHEVMVTDLLKSGKIHTDDTPVKVLDPKLSRKSRTGRIWVYVGDFWHPHTVFDYTPDRSQTGPHEFLRGYRGKLQADGYPGYDGIYAREAVEEVACWAHTRRKYVDVQSTNPKGALEAVAMIKLLYKVEEEAKTFWERLPMEMDEATKYLAWVEKRYELRQEKSKRLMDTFDKWRKRQDVLPKSPLGEALTYTDNQWDALIRYLDDGTLDIDNNVGERALRCIAVGRNNWTFFGSDRGGEVAAIHYSFIGTCKAHDIDPFEYLRDVLTRIADHPSSRLEELLPHRWKEIREAATELERSRASPAA